jgi:hypothetical protein
MLLEVLGEVLFVYGLLGWIYGVTIQLTHPTWLPGGLSHLTAWIRADTFAIVSFLLSILGLFIWTGQGVSQNPSARMNDEAAGDRIISFYCQNCGFVRLHKEINEKKE